jgi:hypothetical protein
MHIGLIIILIIALALVVGPVMMMRPNPAQKNKENLRSIARAKGVHYSMRNIPRQADEQEQRLPLPVYFFPPTKTQTATGWMLVRANYEHDINFLGWWAWQGERRATAAEVEVLKACLPTLPESIHAVSAGGEGVCVYWEEKGGERILQRVLSLLESLKHAVAIPE